MKYVVRDVGPFAAKPDTSTSVKDKFTEAVEQAQGLIVQAAMLNQAATGGQLEAFAIRYARLCDTYSELEGDMARLRGLLDLAATAISEA